MLSGYKSPITNYKNFLLLCSSQKNYFDVLIYCPQKTGRIKEGFGELLTWTNVKNSSINFNRHMTIVSASKENLSSKQKKCSHSETRKIQEIVGNVYLRMCKFWSKYDEKKVADELVETFEKENLPWFFIGVGDRFWSDISYDSTWRRRVSSNRSIRDKFSIETYMND